MVTMHFADDTLASHLALAIEQINDVIEGSLKELTDKEVDHFWLAVLRVRHSLAVLTELAVAGDVAAVKRMEADNASDST